MHWWCPITAAGNSTESHQRLNVIPLHFPALRVLPEVLETVDGRAEVLLDGGIRRGSDVVKALCLGARAVLIGRAYAYGLGAYGGSGVTRAVEILRDDIVRTMKLLGCSSIRELGRTFVDAPREWFGRCAGE